MRHVGRHRHRPRPARRILSTRARRRPRRWQRAACRTGSCARAHARPERSARRPRATSPSPTPVLRRPPCRRGSCEIACARAAPSSTHGGNDGALDSDWSARKSSIALVDQVVRDEGPANAGGRRKNPLPCQPRSGRYIGGSRSGRAARQLSAAGDLDAENAARIGTEVADHPKDAPGLMRVRQRSRTHSTCQDQPSRAHLGARSVEGP